MIRVGSLFTGTGALDLAVHDIVGGEPAWFCETDPAACRVLTHHWPGVPNLGDATTVEWNAVEPVDVLCGGFPCQDVSLAGRRCGLLAEDEGALFDTTPPWEGMRAAIAALRPVAVIENVRGLLTAPVSAVGPGRETLGGAFGRMLSDLAGLGFDAEWVCLPASQAGAPHRRVRVFIIAVAADPGGEERARRAGLRSGSTAKVGRRRSDDGTVAPALGWGRFRPAINRWAAIMGRPAPAGLTVGPHGGLVTSAEFMEWVMGLPPGWVTGVPGLSEEQQRRLLGNGVVPHQAAMALRCLAAPCAA